MAKVLIVDDEDNIRFFYSEELKDEGYEVSAAKDGYMLMERIRAEQPDLVILDIKMAGYNGLELLGEIRKEFGALPVILCSAYSTFRDDSLSKQANAYVVKSSDLAELKREIRRCLEPGPS